MDKSGGIRHVGDGILEVSQEMLKAFIGEKDINELYDVEPDPFARGKFATVRRAIELSTGNKYAAKFLRRRRRGQCLSKDIGHEIAVLLLCAGSKHIVKLHGVHETKTDTVLLLEMATGGELQAILDDEGALTEEQTITCMKEILKALQYLHKKCIAHLDLKPQNILLAGKQIEDGLKLCDFGISRVVEEGGKVCEILGTPDYVAPEVLNYEPLSLQTDIWSIGVLTYVLLTGCSPFGGDTKQETFLNISQCSLTFPDELFEDVSTGAIDFIKSTLRIKPNDRLTVTECLAHSWLSDCATMLINISNPNDILCDEEDNNDCNSKNCNNDDNNDDGIDEDNEDDVDDDDEDDDNNSTTSSSSLTIESSNSSSIILHSNDDGIDDVGDEETNNFINEYKINNIDENKENILITNYFCKARELNLIIEEKKDENRLICEKLSSITNINSSQTSQPQQQHQQTQVTAIINGSNSSCNTTTTTTTTIFPDAPTTPKVCRKAPDSPPSVKELVQRFQIPEKNQTVTSAAVTNSSSPVTSQQHSTTTSTTSPSSARTRCPYLTCYGPVCRHIESQRQSMGIDQGIIC